MSQIDNLEALMRSGACAFKIEGRLKDINYVKNVVSAYNQRLNAIIAKHPDEFRRASFGRVECNFTPDLKQNFQSWIYPLFCRWTSARHLLAQYAEALGEYVGKVKEIRRDSFNVSTTASFANGDGLCFINRQTNREGRTVEALEGFRVNKAVGNRLYPYKMPQGLKAGMGLYRNQDQAFEKELAGQSAVRLLPIDMEFGLTPDGYSLTIRLSGVDVPKVEAKATVQFEHQELRSHSATTSSANSPSWAIPFMLAREWK